jgi:hypothetical protein
MGAYDRVAKIGSLFFGLLITILFFGPLSGLVYFILWVDIVYLTNLPLVKTIGFELQTLAAVIGGIALGPVGGFFFAALAIPALYMFLYQLVYHYWLSAVPSVDYLSMGLAAVLAGILISVLPFVVVVLVALFFKYFVLILINLRISGSADYASAFMNILFSFLVLMAIQATGIISYII